jgi:hypothetical protein
VTVPRYSEQGTWTADYFEFRDKVGNDRVLRTADLSVAGFPTTFTQTGPGDTTAPALASFSFSPTTVDTSASAQTITVTAQITDDLAGVEFGAFQFESPSNQSISVYFDSNNRVSGTALDGTYVKNVTVPRYSEQGTWTADYFEFRDKVGNDRVLRTADLSVAGFPTTFTVTAMSMLRVTTSPAVPSQILVDGVPRDTWGLNWVKLPPGTYTVRFTHVEGYTEPDPQTVNVTTGNTTTVDGTFTQRGTLRVTTSPAVAGTISVDGIPRNDWGVWTDLPTGGHQVCFGAVEGYTAPPCQNITLTAGQQTTVNGTYT